VSEEIALRLSRRPESFGRQVHKDEQSDPVYPKRNRPSSKGRGPLEYKPGQMAECDKREDDAGNEQECLLSHGVPPFQFIRQAFGFTVGETVRG